MAEYYVGLMSGTSVDAIDAVLVDLADNSSEILQTHSCPFPRDIRKEILCLCEITDNETGRTGILDMQLGHLFANATRTLLSNAGVDPSTIIAIGSHGQTIRHQPEGDHPFSLQIGNPAVIALQTGINTVADFRNADIAAGGQGAPLVPAFHDQAFGSSGINRVILNIGGIANITVLPADTHQVTGFDTGPGNTLMDAWMQEYFNESYDDGGQLAHQGTINKELLNSLLQDPYFAQAPPKSTGREYFNLSWLSDYLEKLDSTFEPRDILSTLTELSALTIANAISQYAPATTEVLVCGGGTKNQYLLSRLSGLLSNSNVDTTRKYGLDPDWVEAVAFAWLAKQAIEGKPGNIPSVTGAKHPVVLGGIYKTVTS